ncbi:hypothetical protein N9W89_03455 [Hellea sp.]|nr:hypothetical protein [Hellea sp.]
MPKSTRLTIAATAALLVLSPAAFAQDKTSEITSSPEIAQIDIFKAADADADGALNRNEFISFVAMKSDIGDADYSSIKLAGSYDDHFNTKDYNADGLLRAEELVTVNVDSLEEAAPQKAKEIVEKPGQN